MHEDEHNRYMAVILERDRLRAALKEIAQPILSNDASEALVRACIARKALE